MSSRQVKKIKRKAIINQLERKGVGHEDKRGQDLQLIGTMYLWRIGTNVVYHATQGKQMETVHKQLAGPALRTKAMTFTRTLYILPLWLTFLIWLGLCN